MDGKEETEKAEDYTRVGLTLPISLMRNLKSLYLSTSLILHPDEINFSDFVNTVSHFASFGSLEESSVEQKEETTFYNLRVPTNLKHETIDALAPGGDIWKKRIPIDFNQYIKNQLFNLVSTWGNSIQFLGFTWYVKIVVDLLDGLINSEAREYAIRRGLLPRNAELKEFYRLLNNLLLDSIEECNKPLKATFRLNVVNKENLDKFKESIDYLKTNLEKDLTEQDPSYSAKVIGGKHDELEDFLNYRIREIRTFPVLVGSNYEDGYQKKPSFDILSAIAVEVGVERRDSYFMNNKGKKVKVEQEDILRYQIRDSYDYVHRVIRTLASKSRY
ncbi:MAG: hypothetical protein M0Z77_04190 [Thermoplasmatales archaeon]|jgi:hypothetical protein|nr:hypothetical protein [Candidatus Thermoplasmatota archaeon]MDA8054835.1 hypothetical protein [Thermoplasmatales archaeon]